MIAQLIDVTKKFGDIIALDAISLGIPNGDFLALVGPNGSGKTTLLRILAGIEQPTYGRVYINGQLLSKGNLAEARTKSTMVFQRTALFSTTVYKNVAYGLKLRKLSKQETRKRVQSVLELVRLEGYEERHARKLSGGEQQRVSLARALALQTEMLLLDEPTANLDERSVSIIENAISQLRRETDTTVVVSTHNMFQARVLSEKVALINNGRLVDLDETQKILGDSRKLGSLARIENIFSGVSSTTSEGTTIVDVGDGVTIEAAVNNTGKISVFIRPEDIIVSEAPLHSSARNVFGGRIMEIVDLGSTVRLKIDAGKAFTVQITRRSFVEMGLNLSSRVFLAFKASSVRVLD